MFHPLRYSKPFMLFCLISALALFALFTSPIITAKASQADAPIKDVKSLLNDYSLYLSTDATSHKAAYSPNMASLVQERRDFYAELFKMGLHSNLNKLESKFIIDDSMISTTGDTTHVKVVEIVTMDGSPITKTAEEYPMIPAAEWAISKTNNKAVQEELKQYIESTTYFANESISNGFEMVFRVNHDIDMINKDGQLQINRDEFTDKASDNGGGFDNVTWVDGKPLRSYPDYTGMMDYTIYNTPIEVLGQQLLDDYTKAYGDDASRAVIPAYAGTFYYNRIAARDYALAHVTPFDDYTTCSSDTTNIMDTSFYGPLYQNVWNVTAPECDDCANYVSQALRAGGFLSDSFWNSQGSEETEYSGTYAWRVFDFTSDLYSEPGLAYYLQNTKQAIDVSTYPSSLIVGDLMYADNPRLHVVIVTGINPLRFSGHTNDRKDYPWLDMQDVLIYFWHIKSSFPQSYTFTDVPPSHWAWQEIERLSADSITAGCSTSPLKYCPGNYVTRAEMAVFLLKGKYGAAYTPPTVGTSTGFNDVSTAYWAAAWIKQLAAENITGGCSANPPLYCPEQKVTHAQMAVFLLRSKHGPAYIIPDMGPDTGFNDVPPSHWAAAWIEQLAAEEISIGAHVYGCGGTTGYYCPENNVTRAEMAGMLLRAFNLR